MSYKVVLLLFDIREFMKDKRRMPKVEQHMLKVKRRPRKAEQHPQKVELHTLNWRPHSTFLSRACNVLMLGF